MSIDNNLYEKSIKILTDLIAFKTVSGQDNSSLIDYCENILNDIGIDTFKVYDDDKKRVNLFWDFKSKKSKHKKTNHIIWTHRCGPSV
jgi:acetylornithine deacetylase